MARRLNLDTTRHFHQWLIDCWRDDPDAFGSICREAQRALADRGMKFEGARDMSFALSALCLDQPSAESIQHIGETLHTITEKALDWTLEQDERRERFFPEHHRMLPWLKKAAGQRTWEGVSRYDAVVTPQGQVKILELNTGCPAGFLHAEDFSQVTEEALKAVCKPRNVALPFAATGFGSIPSHTFVDGLLAAEADAEIEPGLIGLVNDENKLQNELALIAKSLNARGRDAEIMNAAEIVSADGRAKWNGRDVSLMYNKIRISTADSPGWNWKPGFESRYASYLDAIRRDECVAMNNLCALTVGEDKTLLEVFHNAEFQATLGEAERAFIAEHVLWTTRLQPGSVSARGREVDLMSMLRMNKDRFVIKPANEGRGFGVVIGRHASDDEWAAACQVEPNLPCIVQEYAEPVQLPVVYDDRDMVQIGKVHLTLGLAMIRGEYAGLLSRVSANPVTNVGLEGIVQAVFVTS